jgi:multidrug resistance efflux pump
VKKGAPLLRLDDSLMVAQRAVAAAQALSAQNALTAAKAQYQIALETALKQDKKTRLQDWFTKDPGQFDQPGWYFTRVEQIQSAQKKVDAYQKEVEDAQSNLTKITQSVGKSDFITAEQRLLDARLAYLISRDVNNRTQNATTSDAPVGAYNSAHCGSNQGYRVSPRWLTNVIYGCAGDANLSSAGKEMYDAAQKELADAQKVYNDLLSTQAASDVLQARANVSVAQERYYAALDFLHNLQTGDQSESVNAARGTMEQAQSAAQQAQSNLDLLDAQIVKLTIYAPMDGVVLARNVDAGEFVQPGGAAMTLANINDLTITVYVTEDRYGEIHLGQTANVSVDSFPAETFTATVSYISNRAEFTPRNVQTVQGRSATVYAVKLKVSDPADKLKPGMPSDVVFVK